MLEIILKNIYMLLIKLTNSFILLKLSLIKYNEMKIFNKFYIIIKIYLKKCIKLLIFLLSPIIILFNLRRISHKLRQWSSDT